MQSKMLSITNLIEKKEITYVQMNKKYCEKQYYLKNSRTWEWKRKIMISDMSVEFWV
jgi:hypothetical protein